MEFTDLERGGRPIRNVETLALASRRQEYLVVDLAADGFGETWLKVNGDDADIQRARTEIFHPVVGRLHAVSSVPLLGASLDSRA